MIKSYLRLLVACAALLANAAPSFANFDFTQGSGTHAFAIDAANQGTALCQVANTECPATILVNTAGAPLGVAALPLQMSLANTGANATPVKVDNSAVTQPISAASLPLPSGAATLAGLTTINTTLGSPFQAGGSIGNASFAVTQGTASSLKGQVDPLTALNWNTTWAGGTLGAMANYGTSPGAVLVPSVNAFVTNTTFGPAATTASSPVVLAFSASTTLQSAATGNGNGTDMELEGYGGAVLHVVCSVACSGGTTINFEVSFDGTTYVAIQGSPIGGGAPVSTATTTGDFGFDISGYSDLRARVSAYSAGTITVTGFAAAQPASQFAYNVSQFGGANVVTGTGAAGAGIPRFTVSDDAKITLGVAADTASVPVVSSPSGNATAGIPPVVCGSAVSSCVLKASAGNLYAAYADCTSACWLMVFNATAAPSNGATTAGIAANNMVECVPIAAGGVGGVAYAMLPAVYTTGMTATISSTACGTLTLATTGFIHGLVK